MGDETLFAYMLKSDSDHRWSGSQRQGVVPPPASKSGATEGEEGHRSKSGFGVKEGVVNGSNERAEGIKNRVKEVRGRRSSGVEIESGMEEGGERRYVLLSWWRIGSQPMTQHTR